MIRWKTGVALALAATAGTALARGPVVSAQKEAPPASVGRVLQLVGGGSWIGVSISDVTADDTAKAKLPAAAGVMVDEVTSESPAATAGIKQGDVIVEFDGERVRSARQLARLVQETPPGRKVQCSVIRDGQQVPLTIEPRESDNMRSIRGLGKFDDFAWAMPAPPAPPAPPVPPSPPAKMVPPVPPAPPDPFRYFDDFDVLPGFGTGRLGVTVNELQPQLAEFFGTKAGVLVTSVTADSTAAKAGVKAGDVITELNGEQVTSTSELRRRTSRLEDGAELTLGVVRDKKAMTLKGKVETSTARRRTHTVL